MQFKYGSYSHDDEEVKLVSFDKRKQYSQRGKLNAIEERLTLEGVLIPSSPTESAMKSAIASLESAYSADGKNAILFHDNGTESAHSMRTADYLTGTRVLDLTWLDDKVYTTGRGYRITITGTKESAADDLLQFQETLQLVGNTGPRYVFIELANGTPRRQPIAQKTTQTVTQSGSAVGFLSYPSIPGPLFGSDELQDRRRIAKIAPKFNGTRFVEYGVQWSYTMIRSTPSSANPNQR